MTISQALISSAQFLHLNGIKDSHLQARIILQNILNFKPAQLFSASNHVLKKKEVERLWTLILRCLSNEPLAYLVGHKEFYEYDFYVDSRVLIPRPETELIVESALECINGLRDTNLYREKPLVIADIGTGCGAIAVALALKSPDSTIYAIDTSEKALQVARVNCKRHLVDQRIKLLHGNLLEPLPQPVDVIVANLPYIMNSEFKKLSPEIIYFEPSEAILGGEDGMRVIEGLLSQLEGKVFHHTSLFLEIGKGMDVKLISLLKRHVPNANYSFIADYSGIKRVAKITFTHI
jgi:release factor glutamine methyltransferase